ncbi:MAG: hypothetical protein LQ342_001191 [Letrouitia transgressa]|nr:MAG: hypothetical protein LQ342_001191 [Letrouitia transgressa]
MPALDTYDQDDQSLHRSVSAEQRAEAPYDVLNIPKNRSTGDLLPRSGNASENSRMRVSFDVGTSTRSNHEKTPISPILTDHDVSLGAPGLRRIRQQPPSRPPSHPSSPNASFSLPKRASSMTLGLSHSRTWTNGGPSSPALNFSEDLSRFPSESLHSFSFAHQADDGLHNRQSILKRSIDFLRDKIGWAGSHPGIVNAQAKVSGDAEVQGMMELLSRANVLGIDTGSVQKSQILHGPFTGPADTDGANIFERAFLPRSQSTEATRNQRSIEVNNLRKENVDPSRPGSSQIEPSLSSEPSVPDDPGPPSPNDTFEPKSAQSPRSRGGLKRTYTDLSLLTLQTKLVEALSKPYTMKDCGSEDQILSSTPIPAFGKPMHFTSVHGHANRSAPVAQAIFTTETKAPWTILAANDLACLVIGVTKAEVRKISILEIVREDKRAWLEGRIRFASTKETSQTRQPKNTSRRSSPSSGHSMAMGNGVTAQLLSKPSSREIASQKSKSETANRSKNGKPTNKKANRSVNGVLLCGDIVPIQKRNGATGSASLWVKENRGSLVWVLEEISEDSAKICLDEKFQIQEASGSVGIIFGTSYIPPGTGLQTLIPRLPTRSDSLGSLDFGQIRQQQYFAGMNAEGASLPVSVFPDADRRTLHVSSFPNIAGIVVLSAKTLDVISSNAAFSAALFGLDDPDNLNINTLIPQFDEFLEILEEEDDVAFTDGVVIPEHSFRKAQDVLALRNGTTNPAAIFSRPAGLIARHCDGIDIRVDVQMRIVRSEKVDLDDSVIEEIDETVSDITSDESVSATTSELVYALWITYSRQLHSSVHPGGSATPILSKSVTPHQPSPGQNTRATSPQLPENDDSKSDIAPVPTLTQQIQEATSQPISDSPPKRPNLAMSTYTAPVPKPKEPPLKKKITDFVILEEMGQGAYGQVKLARYANTSKKVVLKYVTKKRILVDTWTRDRRLGTVPLEIHVLDYLRRDGLKHPNIVEMLDFFEDDINYYIEMVPHGLPGMDLFDYIEMRPTMDEVECRGIFQQVVAALHHLHTKALVVHRDIKDENIILDSENNVKLIDFGSAAYIKNGPFEVFVGTIDYAAPEVLQGKSYRGKEQDVWALGILLYTLIYKENPFYSIDEIMDHELRIPWILSDASIDLIKAMLNRDVDQRLTITQVMGHPWCQNVEVEDGAELSS